MTIRRSTFRGGFTITEMMVALVLFAVAAVAIGQLTLVARLSYRQLWELQTAGEAIANIAEEVNVLPWEELTDQRLARLKLPDEVLQQLPEAELHAAVKDVEGQPAGKQITLELSRGEHLPGQRLTFWRFHPEESP